MKKFFILSFLFLLPLVAGFLWLEKRLVKIPNSYNQKKDCIEKQLNDIEFLVLGTSHTLYGVDPACFSHKGFNLANISQTPYYDARLTEYYLDKLPRLKMVIIPVSYFSFYKQLKKGAEDWREYFYYYYWKIKIPDRSVFDLNKYSLFTIYTPYSVMGFARMHFRNSSAPKYTFYGFEKKEIENRQNSINDKSGFDRVEFLNRGYNDTNYNAGVADFEYLLQLLKKKNIQPVFITTPAWITYSRNLNPVILERNKIVIDSLCRKYNGLYFNHLQDSHFNLEDFADNDHLDFQGAEKFSHILDSEISVSFPK